MGSVESRSQQAKATKAAARETALATIVKLLPENVEKQVDSEFLSADVTQIVKNIEHRKPGWNATRVMEVFIRSSMRSHELTNCLTEIDYERALHRAQELDAEFAATGKIVGPLHGVPISIKDQINVAGLDSSIGFSNQINSPATKDATLVTILKNAGAIPFTKTNVPQTMLAFECGNPVFGVTTNPYSRQHTCGGSSGGEGAVIGSDGSPCGIGTDIGGSLRIPAHYSGCFALKPTGGRWPTDGMASPNKGFEGIASTAGPMARSVDDLILITRTVLSATEDRSLSRLTAKHMPPVPFREVELPKKLKFGYYKTDDLLLSSPACQRAVQESVDALTKIGHECVEIKAEAVEALRIFVALTSADGYERLLSGLDGDPREDSLFLIHLQKRLGPTVLRMLTKLIVSPIDPISSSIMLGAGIKPVAELLEWQSKRDDFCARVRHLWWGELGLDGIICPVQASPAIKIGGGWNCAFLAAATIMFNTVDSPVGIVPVTQVDGQKDALTAEWLERGCPGSPLLETALYGKTRLGGGMYDPAGEMQGLPVAVQIAGAAYEDEKVLQMCQVLDKALGPRQFGPGKFVSPK